MNIILEVEVKLNYDGTLEYMNEEVYGPYSTNEVQTKYEALVDTAISRGYFDNVDSRTSNRTRLSNGGTATKYFIIKSLK